MTRVSVDEDALEEVKSWAIEWSTSTSADQAIRALDPQPLTWQPIADAPKDGTMVILGHPNKGAAGKIEVSHGHYHRRDRRWVHNLHVKQPSLFMPLPDAPTKETTV